ncbi:unnamed protein product [Ixodes persulcatus]
MAWARARRRDPTLPPVILEPMPYSRPSECCPSVTEAIQPLGGVSITGRILELYREVNATQRFYQTSCRDHVRGRPCRFMRSKYEPHSRCVQTYSYMYALVREFQSDAPWRLDYIRYRNGCTCQIQRPRTYAPGPMAGVETSPKAACARATREDLERLLGSAFNARYMAIDKPDPEPTSSRLTARHSEDPLSDQADLEAGGFSVDADFRQDLPGERRRVREKRSETAKPWGCASRLEWEDLGDDRFPRYLRNVKCLGGDCWFGKFRCKARAFTVKVLRRKSGKEKDGDCVVSASTADLPAELREHWEFEERAVAFCCDCSVDD